MHMNHSKSKTVFTITAYVLYVFHVPSLHDDITYFFLIQVTNDNKHVNIKKDSLMYLWDYRQREYKIFATVLIVSCFGVYI